MKAAVDRMLVVKCPTFRTRIDHWSSRLRVHPTQVRIQRMTRKWASCSPQGRVTFSRDLMEQPPGFQDYVIAHELLHLRIRNHGKLFTTTLRMHLQGSPWIWKDIHGVNKNPTNPIAMSVEKSRSRLVPFLQGRGRRGS
jgi:hypothetical protein